MLEAQRQQHERWKKAREEIAKHARPDDGIDLKRKKPKPKVIPIDQTLNVPVTVPFSILEAGDIANIIDPEIPYISVSDIQSVVCRHYKVSRIDLLSVRRQVNVCWPRHVAMWLCKDITGKSYPHIARRFGGRDHTTAMSAIRKVERKMGEDPNIKAEVESLRRKVRGEDQ